MTQDPATVQDLPPLEHPDENELCLGWHALNYRTAHALHAEDSYQTLTAFVQAYARTAVEAAVSKEREVGWQPIETAPKFGKDRPRQMFVIRAFDVTEPTGGRPYTSDPWCTWALSEGDFARWPHRFRPTHWMPLPPHPTAIRARK